MSKVSYDLVLIAPELLMWKVKPVKNLLEHRVCSPLFGHKSELFLLYFYDNLRSVFVFGTCLFCFLTSELRPWS
jgi:hypothetical protein